MKTLCRAMPLLFALALLVSCGGEEQVGIVEARSMEDALALAAENSSFVVIEFWLDG
jgi:hypothetical protein